MCYFGVPYRSVYAVTMASSTKPANGNGTLGKRKKSRESRNSYLSKWLDKTMNHVQDASPSMDTYESYINTSLNWTPGGPFCPSIDPYRIGIYGLGQEPTSLPAMPTFFNPTSPPFYPDYRYIPNINKGIQVQRPRKRIPNGTGRAEDVTNAGNGSFNSVYISKNYTDSQDFASLPPIVTSVGDTTSNSDLNMTEKEDGNRRFSDPCLRELTDVAQPNGEGTGSESDSDSGSHVGSKLLSCLVDQINTLKITNERLNKELHETKNELNVLRQQNAIWHKNSAPTHSPLSNGMQYSPGMVTDVVREIREATRVREEALYARVRALVMDRNDHGGIGALDPKLPERNLEEIKTTLRAAEIDKRRMLDRISKLENELRTLTVSNGVEHPETNGNVNNEETDECARLRKELADMRSAKQLAEERTLKLEQLVTQLRSKFNSHQSSANGPESLPSSDGQEVTTRARRTSVNSLNTTVVFGPVTDL